MKKVVIFGIKDLASLANWYITNDDPNSDVVAFTVSEEFVPEDGLFEGLPVVSFEDVENTYNPDEYLLFAPMSNSNINMDREKIYNVGKEKGYAFYSYISSHATVLQPTGFSIGENCFILEDNTIQPFTSIGNNCVLWSGNHIGHHGSIGDHVFFTSHVVMSGHVTVNSHSFFGVNSTIRDGVIIAKGSLIAMGALITKSTEEWGVYKGAPAKKGSVPSNEL